MNEMGHKLRTIRNRRKLSLRQVERLTKVIANRYGDKARGVSASWLGRIERENHSIAHKRLESLKEVYGVSHEELAEEPPAGNESGQELHSRFPDIPSAVLKGLISLEGPLLPPEDWMAYFPKTTLLPPLSHLSKTDRANFTRRPRGREPLYGILGANDTTLVPFVQPGAVVEIDTSIRTINPGRIFHSIFERPIYFLRSHDGYHCGWCELDAEENWLALVPSAMTATPQRRWRYKQDVEVIGVVKRILTRLGFPDDPETSINPVLQGSL